MKLLTSIAISMKEKRQLLKDKSDDSDKDDDNNDDNDGNN
jgi:hypothetical protein